MSGATTTTTADQNPTPADLPQHEEQLSVLEKQLAWFRKQRRPVVVYLQKCESWLVDRGALEELNKLDETSKATQDFFKRRFLDKKNKFVY
jgi:hypothetical protein